MRYIKQRDLFGCTPVGIVNALKHLGYKQTYNDVGFWKNALATSRNSGTRRPELIRAVEQLSCLLNLRVLEYWGATNRQIAKALDAGQTVLMSARVDGEFRHTFLIAGHTPTQFIMANCRGRTNARITKQKFSRMVRERLVFFMERI